MSSGINFSAARDVASDLLVADSVHGENIPPDLITRAGHLLALTDQKIARTPEQDVELLAVLDGLQWDKRFSGRLNPFHVAHEALARLIQARGAETGRPPETSAAAVLQGGPVAGGPVPLTRIHAPVQATLPAFGAPVDQYSTVAGRSLFEWNVRVFDDMGNRVTLKAMSPRTLTVYFPGSNNDLSFLQKADRILKRLHLLGLQNITDDLDTIHLISSSDLTSEVTISRMSADGPFHLIAHSPAPKGDDVITRARVQVYYGDPPGEVMYPALRELRASVRRAMAHTNIPEALRDTFLETVRHGIRTIRISFNYRRADGSTMPVVLYRFQHNDARGTFSETDEYGTTKGGIRLLRVPKGKDIIRFADKDLGIGRFLAAGMSRKTAVAGLPLGGGKGDVFVPEDATPAEIEEIFRLYGYHFAPFIGPKRDVPAPDYDTNAPHMNQLRAGYEARTGEKAPGVTTAKSLDNGGILGRDEATGRGGFEIVSAILAAEGKSWKDITVAIQGHGNSGGFAAISVTDPEVGGKVIATSDTTATLTNPQGFSQSDLRDWTEKKDANKGLPRQDRFEFRSINPTLTSVIPNADAIWDVQSDVLFVSSKEGVLTADVAKRIKPGMIIVELANTPTTAEADRILQEKGCIVIPDILANSGGVIVSFLEMVQNAQQLRGEGAWSREKTRAELQRMIRTAYARVKEVADREGIPLREAADVVALEELFAAELRRHPEWKDRMPPASSPPPLAGTPDALSSPPRGTPGSGDPVSGASARTAGVKLVGSKALTAGAVHLVSTGGGDIDGVEVQPKGKRHPHTARGAALPTGAGLPAMARPAGLPAVFAGR